ncbi:MAG: PEP-CTERM sorting domain-containing protein [Methylophilaceae bacterium]
MLIYCSPFSNAKDIYKESDATYENSIFWGTSPDGEYPRFETLTSFGQDGFTATFSQPVNSVSIDFTLKDYFVGGVHSTSISNYYGFDSTLPMTPTILSATFKDANGVTIGSKSEITPFNMNLINGSDQLNNSGFSIGSLKPFSSIDISWDTGSVTKAACFSNYWDNEFCREEHVGRNLLLANNFSYTFANQVAAVPEPETYAMLLAGLSLVGFATSRKKRVQLS